MRRTLTCLAMMLFSPFLLANEPDFPERLEVDEQTLVLRNESLLRYLFVDVYSAALLTPADISPANAVDQRSPLHLELYYYRNIDREDVVKAAWVALERQHDDATLERLRPAIDELHATFSDIQSGDRYSLTLSDSQALRLSYNDEVIFTSDNEELARTYVGIWLEENGLSDSLRQRLLAER
ncbi:chalcone isomerase family protein [Halopseudomonas salegens]|uniref:Chalcone isomerase-like n=1 Tax=Halopseudomonas salegens TaxID=1434072 RepID=A0A1H2EXB0_9GAMM|nr:chalcone isomerase family protein [Halopseudomonas salegens]SDT99689.1 Chalcone isomerase-like [Halopseudomonas salegens]